MYSCTELWSEKVPDLSNLGPIWPILGPNLVTQAVDSASSSHWPETYLVVWCGCYSWGNYCRKWRYFLLNYLLTSISGGVENAIVIQKCYFTFLFYIHTYVNTHKHTERARAVREREQRERERSYWERERERAFINNKYLLGSVNDPALNN